MSLALCPPEPQLIAKLSVAACRFHLPDRVVSMLPLPLSLSANLLRSILSSGWRWWRDWTLIVTASSSEES